MVRLGLLGFSGSGDRSSVGMPVSRTGKVGLGDELAVESREPASRSKGGIGADQVGLILKLVLGLQALGSLSFLLCKIRELEL